jgi:uncharacterized phage protein gp47/JayE
MGAISAEAGTINIINGGSTSGWTSVTNASAATAGSSIESDASYRARMVISQALPGITMNASTQAALKAVSGVTRINVIENDTGSVDSYGTPAHSITCVVEGGTNSNVATAIYKYKGIGGYTNGTTSVVVTDSTTGDQTTIHFTRPTKTPIYAALSIKALSGYTSATTSSIQTAVVNYLNALSIGQNVTISALYGAALSVLSSLSSPTFSITAVSAGAQIAQTTGSPVINTNTMVVASNTGIATGQTVIDETNSGTFPSGTTVTLVSGTTITLSNNATASYTSDTVSFFSVGTSDVSLSYYAVSEGISANVVLTVS